MSSDELIGKSLGQYQIRMKLGQGGMSTVYLAYQPSMDRTVAIKVLPRDFLHDPTFLARFQQEARTIARLEHLHILPVYDVGEDQGVPYIVMRHLPGGTLSALIAERLPTISETTRLLSQVADALDYAHGRDIIHRDLKPSNILLDNSHNAYLADFGIARVAQAAQDARITDSQVIGTPPYIAPEMVRKDGIVTHSVDIYALGVIAFEMLTGEPPYYDPEPMKTLMAHVMEPVPSVRKVDPNISREIDSVLMKCLAKSAEERYPTANEFAEAFAKAATPSRKGRERPAPDRKDTPPVWDQPPLPGEEPTPGHVEPAARRRGSGTLLAISMAAGLIVGLGLIALAVTGGQPGELLELIAPQASRTPTPTVTPTISSGGGRSPTVESRPTEPAPALPAPSGGGRLAFASNRDGDFDIFLLDADGENLRQVTFNDYPDFDPAWSPDGTRLVYASNSEGDAEIVVIPITCILTLPSECAEQAQTLTANDATDFDPAWSPDGTRIAFASDRDGDFEIYVMAADGSQVRQLTFNDVDDAAPDWSPDGTQIAYNSESGGDSDLMVIDSGGGVPERLTEGLGLDLWPDWSPDAVQMAFTSTEGQSGGERVLFLLDVATNLTVAITNAPGNDDDPDWSPDGRWIAFDSDRDGGGLFDLFVLEVVSGVLNQITDGAGDNVAPAWQP